MEGCARVFDREEAIVTTEDPISCGIFIYTLYMFIRLSVRPMLLFRATKKKGGNYWLPPSENRLEVTRAVRISIDSFARLFLFFFRRLDRLSLAICSANCTTGGPVGRSGGIGGLFTLRMGTKRCEYHSCLSVRSSILIALAHTMITASLLL